MSLFGPETSIGSVGSFLDGAHYLGAARRGFAWQDDNGVIVFGNPASRRLPQDRWLELARWCLTGGPNAGSRQWAAARRWLLAERPDVTTIVSYSDPAVGHTGALYRACGWLWAPTWHRLRPPPSGNGEWQDGKGQSVKDRWICVLRRDAERAGLLALNDAAVRARWPFAEYREPRFKRDRPVGGTGGGDYAAWVRA